MKSARALFLDRDGVININHGYVHTQDRFEFVDGIFDICRKAKQLDYLLIVVTNQAGIGRGYFTEQDFHALTDWMVEQFHGRDADIAKVYFCPCHPEHGIGEYKRESECRKPNPGMFLAAATDFDLDLSACVMVGDKPSDMVAGLKAGVGCNVLFAPDGAQPTVSIDAVISRLHDLEPFLCPANPQAENPRNVS